MSSTATEKFWDSFEGIFGVKPPAPPEPLELYSFRIHAEGHGDDEFHVAVRTAASAQEAVDKFRRSDAGKTFYDVITVYQRVTDWE